LQEGPRRRFSIVDVFTYPKTDLVRYAGGKFICYLVSCSICEWQSETATVHLDCWQLYAANTPATRRLSRLHRAAVARLPWRECPSAFMLAPDHNVPLVMEMAAKMQLERLASLPPEIQGMIAANLDTSPLWQYSAVLALIKTIETTTKAAESAMMAPISLVHIWRRG
jgi:hypothetical protein